MVCAAEQRKLKIQTNKPEPINRMSNKVFIKMLKDFYIDFIDSCIDNVTILKLCHDWVKKVRHCIFDGVKN
jgi:hypothetical protein